MRGGWRRGKHGTVLGEQAAGGANPAGIDIISDDFLCDEPTRDFLSGAAIGSKQMSRHTELSAPPLPLSAHALV